MSHIHTEQDQHDVTVSAWIFRKEAGELKVFVHMHKKIQKYMEVGGHIELDETPWQTIAHELEEESGYTLDRLKIYQPAYMPANLSDRVVHPVPVFINTYQPIRGHYHTDICYAFAATTLPQNLPAQGESQDIRWYTLEQLEKDASEGEVLPDIVEAYKAMADIIRRPYMHLVSTADFSLEKPLVNEIALEKSMTEPKLEILHFGNPVLRQRSRQISDEEINSNTIASLVQAMQNSLKVDDGVGLAAPQVGESLAVFIIDIHPNDYHPERENFQAVVINPAYQGSGRRMALWEGCLSSGEGKSVLFGKALRYQKITATYQDQYGAHHSEEMTGLRAHVFQHETDHLDGVLFVDKVRDTKTFMTAEEYRKRILRKD